MWKKVVTVGFSSLAALIWLTVAVFNIFIPGLAEVRSGELGSAPIYIVFFAVPDLLLAVLVVLLPRKLSNRGRYLWSIAVSFGLLVVSIPLAILELLFESGG